MCECRRVSPAADCEEGSPEPFLLRTGAIVLVGPVLVVAQCGVQPLVGDCRERMRLVQRRADERAEIGLVASF